MKKHIAVFCYWRTGSNLLGDFMISNGFTNHSEFFSDVVAPICENKLLPPELIKFQIEKANQYYKGTLLEHQANLKTIVKFIHPHTKYVSKEVFGAISTKILLYRENFFNLILSKFVASSRNSWARTIWNPDQPEFNGIYPESMFIEDAKTVLDHFMEFVNSHEYTYDYVVNYENDLVPFVKERGANFLVSAGYNITNIMDIQSLYSEKFEDKFNLIVEFFRNIRKGSKSIHELSLDFNFKYYK